MTKQLAIGFLIGGLLALATQIHITRMVTYLECTK